MSEILKVGLHCINISYLNLMGGKLTTEDGKYFNDFFAKYLIMTDKLSKEFKPEMVDNELFKNKYLDTFKKYVSDIKIDRGRDSRISDIIILVYVNDLTELSKVLYRISPESFGEIVIDCFKEVIKDFDYTSI